jgi:hypothetical protein
MQQAAPVQRFLFDFNSIFSPPYFSERFFFCAVRILYSNQLVTMDNQMNMQQQMVLSILSLFQFLLFRWSVNVALITRQQIIQQQQFQIQQLQMQLHQV